MEATRAGVEAAGAGRIAAGAGRKAARAGIATARAGVTVTRAGLVEDVAGECVGTCRTGVAGDAFGVFSAEEAEGGAADARLPAVCFFFFAGGGMRFSPLSLGLFPRAISGRHSSSGFVAVFFFGMNGEMVEEWGRRNRRARPRPRSCGTELVTVLAVPDGLRSRPLVGDDGISRGAPECVAFPPGPVVLLAKTLASTRGFSPDLAAVAAEVLVAAPFPLKAIALSMDSRRHVVVGMAPTRSLKKPRKSAMGTSPQAMSCPCGRCGRWHSVPWDQRASVLRWASRVWMPRENRARGVGDVWEEGKTV